MLDLVCLRSLSGVSKPLFMSPQEQHHRQPLPHLPKVRSLPSILSPSAVSFRQLSERSSKMQNQLHQCSLPTSQGHFIDTVCVRSSPQPPTLSLSPVHLRHPLQMLDELTVLLYSLTWLSPAILLDLTRFPLLQKSGCSNSANPVLTPYRFSV